MSRVLFVPLFYRVCTGPWKPGKSWNLKIWIPGLERPGIFVEVPESPGIWHIDLYYISNHKHTAIQSLHFFRNMGVSLHVKSLWIHWKVPWIWHWKVLESPGIWDVKMCMNPVLEGWCHPVSVPLVVVIGNGSSFHLYEL